MENPAAVRVGGQAAGVAERAVERAYISRDTRHVPLLCARIQLFEQRQRWKLGVCDSSAEGADDVDVECFWKHCSDDLG